MLPETSILEELSNSLTKRLCKRKRFAKLELFHFYPYLYNQQTHLLT